MLCRVDAIQPWERRHQSRRIATEPYLILTYFASLAEPFPDQTLTFWVVTTHPSHVPFLVLCVSSSPSSFLGLSWPP